jgi:hypothetical protein
VLPDLQAKAAVVMKAEAEAVTVGDRSTAGGGSGGDKDNGGDSDGGCTDTRTINNQLKAVAAMATKRMMDGDSDDNNYNNDGDGGGSGSGGDGGRWWRWAL